MTKETRIKKHKEKLHKIYVNYTDRQLLEQIAYSLMIIGIVLGIGFWFLWMKNFFSW
jgi:hypothetical protein